MYPDVMSIKEFMIKFDRGEFKSPDVDTQCDAGWYDWFCRDSSLVRKTEQLGKKLRMIMTSRKINIDTMYVWFKNNCPMDGSLYDDFRIADIKTGDVIYTIIPKSGFRVKNGSGEVWGRKNKFDGPLFEGSWKEIKEWFLKE